MDSPIRILGIGSPFGDDAAGLEAVATLENRFDPASVSVSLHDRPGAKLVSLMQGARTVVLVDAVKSGAEPGTLHRLEGKAIQRALARYTSTHGFGIAEALQLAEKLGDYPEHLVLWGIEAGTTRPGDEMSMAVRSALPALVNAVVEEVHAFRTEAKNL